MSDAVPEVVVLPLGDGRYLVTDGTGRQQLAHAVSDGTMTWVWMDGTAFLLDRAPDGRGTAARGEAGGGAPPLTAPMPAKVTLVAVAPGQVVSAGDLLVVLEAMKMEMPLTAPHGGTIAAVRCRVGEIVAPGVPLVEIR